ncbi:MAG TPA: cupin domain-containing protein [Anaerolineales bacterium]|nr:cupin domain-containing protein [Anaerolineales bacterium]
MTVEAINFKQKLALFNDQWSPRIIAQLNDYHFKLAKIEGEFVWHSHPETDEVFMVIEGEFEMQLPDKTLALKAGEMCVIPKGVQHRPVAARECAILLVEPSGTVNTGDAGGDLTAAHDDWV